MFPWSLIIFYVFSWPQALLADVRKLEFRILQNQYLSEAQNVNQTDGYTSFGTRMSLESDPQALRSFRGDIMGLISVDGSEQAYVAVPELFAGLQAPDNRGFGLSLGRKKMLWSEFDEEWRLGIWQPQVRWDYLYPVEQGLTGAFATVATKDFTITGFTTPFFLPDQGPHFRLENGEFKSSNRWFRQPQSRHTVMGQDRPLSYELERPSGKSVIFHPGFGLSILVGHREQGFWLKASMANKPINQIHLGVEGRHHVDMYKFAQTVALIHPMVVRHSVATVETGFRNDEMAGWISYTEERPDNPDLPENWEQSSLANSHFFGGAVMHRMPFEGWRNHWMKLGFMILKEDKIAPKLSSDNFSENTYESSLDRYPYRQVVSLEWNALMAQTAQQKLNWKIRYLYSIPEQGSLLSTTLEYDWNRNTRWDFGLDILGAEISPDNPHSEIMSWYRNNDRVRGGLVYVF